MASMNSRLIEYRAFTTKAEHRRTETGILRVTMSPDGRRTGLAQRKHSSGFALITRSS